MLALIMFIISLVPLGLLALAGTYWFINQARRGTKIGNWFINFFNFEDNDL